MIYMINNKLYSTRNANNIPEDFFLFSVNEWKKLNLETQNYHGLNIFKENILKLIRLT